MYCWRGADRMPRKNCAQCRGPLTDGRTKRCGECVDLGYHLSERRGTGGGYWVRAGDDVLRGSYFPRIEFTKTLEYGYWPTGLVVEKAKDGVGQGQLETVCGRECQKQWLEQFEAGTMAPVVSGPASGLNDSIAAE